MSLSGLKLDEKLKYRAKISVLWLLIVWVWGVGAGLFTIWLKSAWPLGGSGLLLLGLAVGFYQFARKSPLE